MGEGLGGGDGAASPRRPYRLRDHPLPIPPHQGGGRDGFRHAVAAPSTGRAAPETNEASSDNRNSAALAISSGLPVRRIGICCERRTISASLSSSPGEIGRASCRER